MKKFTAYAAVFIIGVYHGRVTERVRNLKMIEEVAVEQKKNWDDRMDRFLSEEA